MPTDPSGYAAASYGNYAGYDMDASNPIYDGTSDAQGEYDYSSYPSIIENPSPLNSPVESAFASTAYGPSTDAFDTSLGMGADRPLYSASDQDFLATDYGQIPVGDNGPFAPATSGSGSNSFNATPLGGGEGYGAPASAPYPSSSIPFSGGPSGSSPFDPVAPVGGSAPKGMDLYGKTRSWV